MKNSPAQSQRQQGGSSHRNAYNLPQFNIGDELFQQNLQAPPFIDLGDYTQQQQEVMQQEHIPEHFLYNLQGQNIPGRDLAIDWQQNVPSQYLAVDWQQNVPSQYPPVDWQQNVPSQYPPVDLQHSVPGQYPAIGLQHSIPGRNPGIDWQHSTPGQGPVIYWQQNIQGFIPVIPPGEGRDFSVYQDFPEIMEPQNHLEYTTNPPSQTQQIPTGPRGSLNGEWIHPEGAKGPSPHPPIPSPERHQIGQVYPPHVVQHRNNCWKSHLEVQNPPQNYRSPSPSYTVLTPTGQKFQNGPRFSEVPHFEAPQPGPVSKPQAVPTEVQRRWAQESSGNLQPPLPPKRPIEVEQTPNIKTRVLERQQYPLGNLQAGQQSRSFDNNGAVRARYGNGSFQETLPPCKEASHPTQPSSLPDPAPVPNSANVPEVKFTRANRPTFVGKSHSAFDNIRAVLASHNNASIVATAPPDEEFVKYINQNSYPQHWEFLGG